MMKCYRSISNDSDGGQLQSDLSLYEPLCGRPQLERAYKFAHLTEMEKVWLLNMPYQVLRDRAQITVLKYDLSFPDRNILGL